jgi:uncharacterized membrane protein HdeD (DUF308 family)
MPLTLRKNWWSLLIRGLAAISLGVITVAWRGISVETLTRFFFTYALIDGLVGIAGGVRAAEAGHRWASLVAEGATSVGAAAIVAAWPVSFIGLAYVIGAWALVTGILEIISARRLRRYIEGEFLLLSAGIASLLLGVLMIVLPLAGPPPVPVWLGAYSFVFGAILVALSFRLQPRRGATRISF